MTRYAAYLRVAHGWGMTLGELLGWPRPAGHLEFLMMQRWLELQSNEPSRSDWYLMQVAAEIRAIRHGLSSGPPVRVNDMKLPFPKPSPPRDKGTTPRRGPPTTATPSQQSQRAIYPDFPSQEDLGGADQAYSPVETHSPYPSHVKVVRTKKDRLRPGAENKTPAQLEREAKMIEAAWLSRLGIDRQGKPRGGGQLEKREPDAEKIKERKAKPPTPTPKTPRRPGPVGPNQEEHEQ